MYNIGSALLILGVIYLHITLGLDIIVTILLGLLGVATWAYHGLMDERKRLIVAQASYYEAKAEYYERRKWRR